MAADPSYNQQITFTELTEEEKAVLRECRRNSIVFRGLPLGTFSAYLMRHAIRSGYFPHVKKYSTIYYVGVFSLGFVSGIASYRDACTQKILRLENSRLADQVRGFYQRAGILHSGDLGGQSLSEQQNADYQGFHRSPDTISTEIPGQRRGGNREPPHFEDHSDTPNVSMIPTNDQRSNDEAPPPPSLYFEVDKAKEDKVTSYSELRKKHRERWTPPNISSGPHRVQQPRSRSEGEQNPSEAPMSWFDRDSEQETNSEPGQKIHSPPNRTPYRQGPPIKKNKYGDVIE